VIYTDNGGATYTSNYNIYGFQQTGFIELNATGYNTLGVGARRRAGQDERSAVCRVGEQQCHADKLLAGPQRRRGPSSTVTYGWSPISPLGFPPALLSRSVLGKHDIGAFVYLPGGPGTLLGESSRRAALLPRSNSSHGGRASMRVIISYKNFAANRNISHIGLGVAALNNSKCFNRAGS